MHGEKRQESTKKYRDPSRTAILQACGILAYKMMSKNLCLEEYLNIKYSQNTK